MAESVDPPETSAEPAGREALDRAAPNAGTGAARKGPVFRAGDRVIVRSSEEILETLDADGMLGGLPFMPEMAEMCGKSFLVEHRAEKTCVAVQHPIYPNRRFAEGDVIFLDTRCDGSGHDGCKRGCKIFWREAWLRPFEPGESPAPEQPEASAALLARLKTKVDDTHYFCQSTELEKATEEFPGNKKLWRVRITVREIRNGDRSLPEMIRLLGLWLQQKVLRKLHGDDWLRGPNERAQAVSLGLQPGELVRIKSRSDMQETLDHERGNRGLRICYEMTRFCGGTAEVEGPVDRIINEQTGEMLEMRDTVSLVNLRAPGHVGPQHVGCLCFDEIGDCGREELMYWREAWLERVGDGTS